MSGRLRVIIAAVAGTLLMGCPSPAGPDLGGGDDPLSSNANLATLSLAEAAISPAFDAETIDYSAMVGNDVDEITVTATAADAGATVTAGPGSHAIAVGSNDIAIVVEAEDGTLKTYTVSVTREAPGPSSNADLATLSLSTGSLDPAFDPAVTSYTATVTYAVDTLTVTATAAHSAAVITEGTGLASLSVGETVIEVVVEAEDGSAKTYTVTITRLPASSNADLSALSLSQGILSPSFSPSTTEYTATVAYTTTQTEVSATVQDATAVIASGTGVAALSVGENAIEVVVQAEDGSTNTYTVTVTRTAPSSNANLASLSVPGVTISPSFDTETVSYSAIVDYLTTEVTISATVEDGTATISSGTGARVLSVGDNVVEVVVEAEDESTKVYTVTVTRQPAITRSFRARTATDDSWYDISSTLLGSGSSVEVFVEDGHGITLTTAQSIADEFDANIYDMIHENFGTEVDVDANDKVTILLLDIIDGFTGDGGYVAGYFDPTHMFSSATEPNSNEADMLFMDVDPLTPGSAEFYSTMAHEMQHLVNFSLTYLDDQTIQDTWINEGLSTGAEYIYQGDHIASRINYYNADPTTSIRNGNNFYVWYGFWELAEGGPKDALANYSTVYLFFQWLRIHASNDTSIYSDILGSEHRDFNAVVDAAADLIHPSLNTWEELLAAWMQANLLTAFGGVGLNGYGGEITTTPWRFLPTGGVSAPLSSGEGVVVETGGTSYSPPDGSGPSIRYRGVDTPSKSVDPNGPLYVGNVVIAFNSSTLIAPDDPTETAILPSVSPRQGSVLMSVSNQSAAMPDSYPIGVRFEPGNGLTRDQTPEDTTFFEYGSRGSGR